MEWKKGVLWPAAARRVVMRFIMLLFSAWTCWMSEMLNFLMTLKISSVSSNKVFMFPSYFICVLI